MRSIMIIALLAVARPVAADSLGIAVTTTPNGGQFAPRNVGAIWIEDSAGTFVKTVDRWAGARISHLVAWIAKSGQDADAVTGATRLDHSMPVTLTWDLKNRAGVVVPDGTYTIRMELADSNSSTPAQNHEGTFTFVKGPTSQKQTNLSNGGFTNATITYASGAAACGDGVVNPGETCDGNCPTICPASTDACLPAVLTGTAATCDAVCAPQAITACVSGDGCCAVGCNETNDADCAAGGGNGATSNDVLGGCTTSTGAFPPLMLLGVLAFALGRRRRV